MISTPLEQRPPLRWKPAAAATAGVCLLLLLAYSSPGAPRLAAEPAESSGPPYFMCDGQKLKQERIECTKAEGIYVDQMSDSGCDLFWRKPCFQCCGIPAPYPPSPPPPSPPLLSNKWANAGLNTGLTFAKKGGNTAWTFASANPFETNYKKLGQETGKDYSDQYFKEAHGYINLDDSGTLKAAAEPGLGVFETAVKGGHDKAAEAVSDDV